jgi:hypothetical protein
MEIGRLSYLRSIVYFYASSSYDAYHICTLYNIAKQRMWHWNLCKVMWWYPEDGGLIKRQASVS